MNHIQRQMIKEAYKEGYESALNENKLINAIRRLLGMDNVPPKATGVRQNTQRELAKPIRDTSTGDVIVPGPGSQKIGDPDTSAPPPQSVDDAIDDPSTDLTRRNYLPRVTQQEIDDLIARQKQIDAINKADDLDEPIG